MNGEHSNAPTPLSTDLRSVIERILASAQPSLAKANHVTVHRHLIGELRDAMPAALLADAAPDLLASLKEMGGWIAAGLQASDEAWPDTRCLQHTEEIAARARAAVDKAEGRSNG